MLAEEAGSWTSCARLPYFALQLSCKYITTSLMHAYVIYSILIRRPRITCAITNMRTTFLLGLVFGVAFSAAAPLVAQVSGFLPGSVHAHRSDN
jgi:hypothetical protein